METKKTLGKYIAELRIGRGMAKVELAERIGVSENTVDRWESDLDLPDLAGIKKLAAALNTTIGDLLDNTFHGKLPERAEDLTYQQQAQKKDRFRFGLLTLILIAAYTVLYLLATRTSVLAGLFPAMIALTITLMIIGLFNLGKAIHGSLYAHIEPRRYLLAAFCLIIVPLSFFDWMGYQAERESKGQTNVDVNIETVEGYVDLDLDGCPLNFSYENTGWFGNGTRVYFFDDPQGSLLKQIEGKANWNPLPADANFLALVNENVSYGDGQKGLPAAADGYYFIACNTGEEVIYLADPEAGIRDFIAAVYDASLKRLYITRYSS